MLRTILSISAGASIGAVLRWFLSEKLNNIYPDLPLGTLSANLMGAYLIGIAVALVSHSSTFSSEWRLFIITGFLGGLTTFSTFSAEVVTLLQYQKYTMALYEIALHLGGSILMTFLGIASVTFLVKFGA